MRDMNYGWFDSSCFYCGIEIWNLRDQLAHFKTHGVEVNTWGAVARTGYNLKTYRRVIR